MLRITPADAHAICVRSKSVSVLWRTDHIRRGPAPNWQSSSPGLSCSNIGATWQSMDASCLAQIESCATELARAARGLSAYYKANPDTEPPTGFPSVGTDDPSHVYEAKRAILARVAKLQTLVAEPQHFLQQLACQVSSHLPRSLRQTILGSDPPPTCQRELCTDGLCHAGTNRLRSWAAFIG